MKLAAHASNALICCLVGFANIGNACTVFTVSTATKSLLANNEDFRKPGAISFVPGKDGRFGRVNFGFHDRFGIVERFAQGSMNEKGLAFDAMAVATVPWVEDPDKPTRENLADDVMDHCATVAEVIEYFQKYNCAYLASTQFMFADATGASVVIAWDPNEGLTVVPGTGTFQVATNTRLAASGFRCRRAMRVIQELSGSQSLDVDAAKRSLSAVHQRGPDAFTSYACIYDLKERRVSVYNLTNFDEVVEFDLATELSKGLVRRPLKHYFKDSPSLSEVRSGQQRTEYGTAIKLDRQLLVQFEGEYVPDVAPEVRVRVEATDEGLLVHNPGQPPATLVPESTSVFRLAPDRGQVTFHRSASGEVSGLTLHKGQDVTAKRVRR